MFTPLRSSSLVLLMISRMSVPICNCFHARRTNVTRITTFEGYPCLTLACANLLEPKGSALRLLKSAFNTENFIRRLSWSIFSILSQFTLEIALQPKFAKKLTKNPSFGGSRSSKVIDVDKSKKPVTSACYDQQHVCTYLQLFSH